MYDLVLAAHSWIRWAVVLLGLAAVVLAIRGASGRRAWTSADNKAGLFFVTALDIQLLLGLLLYFAFSPYTALAMDDFGGAMSTSHLRFWAVEHPFGAIIALALAHVGRVKIRKTADPARKHRLAAIFFGLALLAILISIPWPGTPNARPLFPR